MKFRKLQPQLGRKFCLGAPLIISWTRSTLSFYCCGHVQGAQVVVTQLPASYYTWLDNFAPSALLAGQSTYSSGASALMK